ncbi:MAG: hypothetical protein FJZ05_02055 [Candidatus Nealsonbacteria bacterium]|nr:hypothetical protein [Candidatus Nealsonbacteria bacterium]
MKNILKIIFIILGVVFTMLVIAVIVFFVLDPFNLKPLLSNLFANLQTSLPASTGGSDKHPFLSEDQEKLLETIGVNPEGLPTEITPEMEKCFIETLGAERVKEIMEGAAPSPIDFFKAKGCL